MNGGEGNDAVVVVDVGADELENSDLRESKSLGSSLFFRSSFSSVWSSSSSTLMSSSCSSSSSLSMRLSIVKPIFFGLLRLFAAAEAAAAEDATVAEVAVAVAVGLIGSGFGKVL